MVAACPPQGRWKRTVTPGRSWYADASAEITSRWVALAVAAMMRSCAPRGLPSRRVATRSWAWEAATVAS
jgi:hypothetical protein